MRVAIRMCETPDDSATRARPIEPPECFAEFEIPDDETPGQVNARENEHDTVQVTVVLRGRRTELETPALALAGLAMRAIEASRQAGSNDNARHHTRVIDSVGVAVEPAWVR